MTSDERDKQTARTTLLVAALANVPSGDLKSALSGAPAVTGAAAVAAWNALHRHRDPVAVLSRPQYRAALPYLAASVSDECLARIVDTLGDHSEDPTREQLLGALEEVGTSFPATTVAVALASVANDDLPSSTLCAELLAGDPRFGLVGSAPPTVLVPAVPATENETERATEAVTEGETEGEADGETEGETEGELEASSVSTSEAEPQPAEHPTTGIGASTQQREARRANRDRAKAARRRKAEVARQADDRMRERRKQERARPGSSQH